MSQEPGCAPRAVGPRITAQIGYKRRPEPYGGRPAIVVEKSLDRQFEADTPDRVWVINITYIKTHEGWLSLRVVIDLYARRVVEWSAQARMTSKLAVQALRNASSGGANPRDK